MPTNDQQTILQDKPLKRFLRLLDLDKKDISYVVVYAIFGGLISLSIPLGVQAIINLIAVGYSTSWLTLTFVIALATALTGLMKLMQLNITELLQQRIFTRSSFEFAYRIPRFRIEHIRDQYAPELANRFFDTLAVQKGLPKMVTDLSESLLQIIFSLFLLSLYHPFFVGFGIILLLLIAVVLLITGRTGLKTSLFESKYKYKVAYWLEELGRTMSSFKLVGNTTYPLDKTNELVGGYLTYRKKHFSVLRWQLVSVIIIKTLATASLLLIGGWLVIQNEINIGQFVAAEIMVIIVLNSLEKIIVTMETIYDVLTGIEKIGAVTDLELEDESGTHFKELIGSRKGMDIRVENLSYTPYDSTIPILRNLNIDIKAGEKVAITGWNTSGKTTLLKILIGLYEDYTGTLCYNGIPRKNINIASLRTYMGDYITEEHLLHDTLEKNISLGRAGVSLQMIIDVCERVGLIPFIQQQPKGLDTVIPSDGESLPQSVIKKIILARCIVDMPMLVGVEPLLNGLTDEERLQIIRTLTKAPWTLIAVTHKAAMARICDKIIVLNEGEIVFQGTFEELTQQPYARDLFEDY